MSQVTIDAAEYEVLLADKRRMDWIALQDNGFDHQGYGEYAHYSSPSGGLWGSARDVVDEAMGLAK